MTKHSTYLHSRYSKTIFKKPFKDKFTRAFSIQTLPPKFKTRLQNMSNTLLSCFQNIFKTSLKLSWVISKIFQNSFKLLLKTFQSIPSPILKALSKTFKVQFEKYFKTFSSPYAKAFSKFSSSISKQDLKWSFQI